MISFRDSLYKCLSAIHLYVMKETNQLHHIGQQPDYTQPSHQPDRQKIMKLLHTVAKQHLASITPKESPSPKSYKCLFEKIMTLHKKLNDAVYNTDIFIPYVGPTTYMQFLECFRDTYHKKSFEEFTERTDLGKALDTIRNTQQEVEVMKNSLKELRQNHEEASKLSSNLLLELTAKSCELERLKALLGQGSSVLSAMKMVGERERLLAENEEDDKELLALFMDQRSSRHDALLQKAKEKMHHAELEEQQNKQTMMKLKEKALFWQNKIDRNTIDHIKSLNSPPRLIGTIMELMFMLLRQYGDQQGGDKTDQPLTSAQGTTNISVTKKKSASITHSGVAVQTAKMEKEQWLAVQLEISDSQKFLDLLKRLRWEEGLSIDAVSLIESKLDTSTYGKDVSVSFESNRQRSSSTADSLSNRKGLITVAMARHAAECAASMCEFATSIVNYSNSLKPHREAVERVLQ